MWFKVIRHYRNFALIRYARSTGIDSVALEGEDRDHLVMEGDGVDPVKLTNKLRKKVGNADIVKIEEIKKDDKKKNESKGESSEPKMEYSQWYPQYNPVIVYDLETNSNPNICSIM